MKKKRKEKKCTNTHNKISTLKEKQETVKKESIPTASLLPQLELKHLPLPP